MSILVWRTLRLCLQWKDNISGPIPLIFPEYKGDFVKVIPGWPDESLIRRISI